MSRFSLNSLLASLFGRRRRGSGVSLLLLLAGLFACLTGCPAAACGVPYGFARSVEVMFTVARPDPTELRVLAPGTRVLVAVHLPDAVTGPHGLALSYSESRRTSGGEGPVGTATATPYTWLDTSPPQQVVMQLPDGSPLAVQIPPRTPFLNAHQFEEQDAEGQERRYTGYLPGQALAVEGTWEGNGRLTARALYAGTPNDYLTYLATRPGTMLLLGTACSGLGLGLLALGVVLRLLGR